jgi:hypothetical protein
MSQIVHLLGQLFAGEIALVAEAGDGQSATLFRLSGASAPFFVVDGDRTSVEALTPSAAHNWVAAQQDLGRIVTARVLRREIVPTASFVAAARA